jgi:hypothetical protein
MVSNPDAALSDDAIADLVALASEAFEAGRSPVEVAYAREAKRGSPINYGFSAS